MERNRSQIARAARQGGGGEAAGMEHNAVETTPCFSTPDSARKRPAGTNKYKYPSVVDCASVAVRTLQHYIDKLNEFAFFLPESA